MYLAIVFLPLLGAILAGFIALFGAAAVLPGEGPPPGMEEDATDHGPHTHEPQPHGGAAFAHSHDEPLHDDHDHAHAAEPPAPGGAASPPRKAEPLHDDHDHAHAAEPPAPGSRLAELITTTFLMISCVLSWVAFVQGGFNGQAHRVPIFTWLLSR